MATNLPAVMLFADACETFTTQIHPMIQEAHEQDGIPDYPARCEAWNDWTDMLCKDSQISEWQYMNWTHPTCNG